MSVWHWQYYLRRNSCCGTIRAPADVVCFPSSCWERLWLGKESCITRSGPNFQKQFPVQQVAVLPIWRHPQVHLHAGGAGMNLFKSQRQLTACIITSYPCNPWHCFEYVSREMSRTAQAGLSAQRPQPTWNAHTSLNGFELQKSNHLVRKRDTVPRSYFEKLFVLVDLSWRWKASWQYALKMMWKDSKNLMQETRVGKVINERWDGFYWQHYQKLQSKDWDFSKKADNWSQQTPAQFEWSCQNPWTAPWKEPVSWLYQLETRTNLTACLSPSSSSFVVMIELNLLFKMDNIAKPKLPSIFHYFPSLLPFSSL